ncbi:MAG: hypothetical protein RMJ97_07185, partial [Raineya sp.]|nr:hypothetical protein [Raineya sp.]
MQLKNCKNCGKPIIYGRTDKIFCSDNCRIQYHRAEAERLENEYLADEPFWDLWISYTNAVFETCKRLNECMRYIVLMQPHPKDAGYYEILNETAENIKFLIKGSKQIEEIYLDKFGTS